MVHDTVSSVAVTFRKAMFCARSGRTDNAHPMECSSIIQCSDVGIHVVADEMGPAAWTAAGQLCSLTECSR